MKSSPRIREALQLLLEAYEYAQDLHRPVWDFALELATLHHGGLTNNELRWLVYKRYLLHAPEAAILEGTNHKSHGDRRLVLSEDSCFTLTADGVRFAGFCLAHPATGERPTGPLPRAGAGPPPAPTPCWDRDRRELRVGGVIVKQFKVPAANQEIVLQAFQEEMWPACIDDPLPGHPCIDAKRRLHDTLGSLNRNQQHPLIRFLGNGNGDGIRWSSPVHPLGCRCPRCAGANGSATGATEPACCGGSMIPPD